MWGVCWRTPGADRRGRALNEGRSDTDSILFSHGEPEELRHDTERGQRWFRQLLRPEPLDLNQMVTSCADELRSVLGSAVDLRLSLEPGLPSVLADHASMGQVLRSLAANARDAMPGGGVLRLETRRTIAPLPGIGDRDVVELAVEDTGQGIAPDVLDQVFDPFFTTKPQGEGTGLGLSMVQGICARAGVTWW